MAKPKLKSVRITSERLAIYSREQRAAKVSKIINVLQQGRQSKFEYEAAARHGLRQALVLQGHAWALSDDEAARIVSTALREIGAVRPPWSVGQREATIPRENCQRCGAPLDDEQIGNRQRYCDDVCAKSAELYRSEHHRHVQDLIRSAVFYDMFGRREQPQECPQCGKSFQPLASGQKHCSIQCHNTARRTVQSVECPVCAKRQTPKNRGGRYCSIRCRTAGRKLEMQQLPKRECDECGGEFQPIALKSKHCSRRCLSRAWARNNRKKKIAADNS